MIKAYTKEEILAVVDPITRGLNLHPMPARLAILALTLAVQLDAAGELPPSLAVFRLTLERVGNIMLTACITGVDMDDQDTQESVTH